MQYVGGLVSVEDASCHKLTELMLNVEEVRMPTPSFVLGFDMRLHALSCVTAAF